MCFYNPTGILPDFESGWVWFFVSFLLFLFFFFALIWVSFSFEYFCASIAGKFLVKNLEIAYGSCLLTKKNLKTWRQKKPTPTLNELCNWGKMFMKITFSSNFSGIAAKPSFLGISAMKQWTRSISVNELLLTSCMGSLYHCHLTAMQCITEIATLEFPGN